MAVYPPEDERRIRLSLPEFGTATQRAGHDWALIDVTTSFEAWMAHHEYREAYFELPSCSSRSCRPSSTSSSSEVKDELPRRATRHGVVGLLGVGTLFGLGEP